jgi:Kef-type K+ transport system membrane component KefB
MLFGLFLLFAAARIGGAAFVLLRQPAVVGEIIAGLVIGPHLLGLISESPIHDVFAELGVVFLLFIVGLETQPRSLWRVGKHAASVGTLGVIVPFLGGLLLMRGLGWPLLESLFVGTALTATSVGITARVMSDLKVLHTRVAQVILGAAVFDDILAMLVLAVVSGLAAGTLSLGQISLLAGESIAFCVCAFLFGRLAVRRLSPRLSSLGEATGRDALFALAMVLCFAFSALADLIGLAAIIGAFFAGLIFAELPDAPRLRHSMQPIYEFLVPIFFVLIGVKVDLHRLLTLDALPLGLLITLVAILGKLVGCGVAALPLSKREALTIGIGMVPRGEVGIVVALMGISRGVISSTIYSEIILMSVLTSIFAPPLLRALLAKPRLPMAEESTTWR